jgi:hypothetical protein
MFQNNIMPVMEKEADTEISKVNLRYSTLQTLPVVQLDRQPADLHRC